MAGRHVAVVIPTWNALADTRSCLRSLARSKHHPVTAIVVDNGSSDGTAAALAAEFPGVEVVRSEVNLGYAAGTNLGLERALELGVDYVLLLNNDTELEAGAVEALVEEAERAPVAGALCSKILFWDAPGLVWFAGARFDPRRGYNGRHRGYRQPDDGRWDDVHETDRACGAAMLVPRDVLEDVGLLDEELFAYGEDTEWSLRARRAGLRLLVVPASRVRHKVSGSAGGESSPSTIYYDLRNGLEILERHAPLGRAATWLRRAEAVGAHAVQALLSGSRRQGLRATLDGWRDFRRRRLGPRR